VNYGQTQGFPMAQPNPAPITFQNPNIPPQSFQAPMAPEMRGSVMSQIFPYYFVF